MNFNKLFESIFKPASEEEVKERKEQSKIEEFKELMDENNFEYVEDKDGNILSIKDINKQDDSGWSLLHFASWRGYINVVKMLLDQGANVNLTILDGSTALILASFNNRLEISKILLNKGATVDNRNKYGQTALNVSKSVEMKELLKSYGAKE